MVAWPPTISSMPSSTSKGTWLLARLNMATGIRAASSLRVKYQCPLACRTSRLISPRTQTKGIASSIRSREMPTN